MRPIRVLEMIDRPFLGGGQRNLLSLASSLDRERFRVSVCSAPGGPLVDEVRRLGLDHLPVPLGKTPNPRTIREIHRVLKDGRFDLVHTHGGVAGLFGRRAARKAGVSVIVHTIHGIHYLHYRSFLLRKLFVCLERSLSRRTSAVILVCEADLNRARDHRLAPEDLMVVIRNGIDFDAVARSEPSAAAKKELRSALGLPDRMPLLGTVARLHRQKGIPVLLAAMEAVRGQESGARLVIVGGGPEEKRLKADVARRGLEDAVLILGERRDAGALLSLFDVFVLSSLWEGLPYVLLEAAALAKPVAAAAVDGVREIVQDGRSGLLVPPRDPAALAGAALRLLRDPRLATSFGTRLKEEASMTFTLTRMTEEVQSLYLRLLKV